MKHLNVINKCTKNTSYRSLSELMNQADKIKEELLDIDLALKEFEIAALTINILGDEPSPKGSKVSKKLIINAPTQKELAKHFSILVDLDEKLHLVDSMIAQLSYQFKNERAHEAATKELRGLRKDVEKRLNEVYRLINKIARGTIPKVFKTFCSEIFEHAVDMLDGFYDKAIQRLIVDVESDTVRYTYYIKMTNVEDDQGYNYKEYYMVFSYITGIKKHALYVNTLITFRPPGKFNMGQDLFEVQTGSEPDPEVAIDMIINMMIAEGFKDIIQNDYMPIGEEDLNQDSFSDWVSDIEFNKNSIKFKLLAGNNPDDVLRELFILVKGLLDSRVPDHNLKYKVNKKDITFYLDKGDRTYMLDREKLFTLQDQLGLTDSQIRKIIQEVM